MFLKIFSKMVQFRSSFRVVILAFLWTISMLCGVCFFGNDPLFISWMRLMPYSQVSIVGLAVVLILPLLISFICFSYANTIIIYVLSALKGFLFGCCLSGLSITFGDASWLMRSLLFFSDSSMTLVMLWYWFRHISGVSKSFMKDSVFAFLIALIIGIIDYFLVSPFLVSLINRI